MSTWLTAGLEIDMEMQSNSSVCFASSVQEGPRKNAWGVYGGIFIIDIPLMHYENMPIQIYWKFYHQKMKIFR